MSLKPVSRCVVDWLMLTKAKSPFVNRCKQLLELRTTRKITQDELEYQLAVLTFHNLDIYGLLDNPPAPPILHAYNNAVLRKVHEDERRKLHAELVMSDEYKAWKLKCSRVEGDNISSALWLEECIMTLLINNEVAKAKVLMEEYKKFPVSIQWWYKKRKIRVNKREIRNKKALEEKVLGSLDQEVKENVSYAKDLFGGHVTGQMHFKKEELQPNDDEFDAMVAEQKERSLSGMKNGIIGSRTNAFKEGK